MSESRTRTMFQSRATDALDKVLLCLAFVLGISGSILLKVYDFNVLIPAIYSAAVIIIYSVAAYTLPRVQLESDQVGDNAYYLGFVLTLTSLSFTLYELSGSEAKTEFIAEVIAGFGIALSSTIVGVAVRVLFLQFRLDLVARDREARLALGDAMRQFRAELSDTIRGVKFLGIEIRQSLNEHHNELAKSHAAVSQSLHEAMLASFRDALKPAGAHMIRMIAEVTENATASMTASAEARAQAEVQLRTSIEAFATTLSSDIEKMHKALEASITAAGSRVASVSLQLEQQLASSSNAIKGFSEQLAKQIGETVTAIAASNRDAGAISSKAIEEATAAIAANVTRIAEALQQPSIDLSGRIEDATQGFAQLIKELERWSEALKKSVDLAGEEQWAMTKGMSEAVVAITGFANQVKQLEVSNIAAQRELIDQISKIQGELRETAVAQQSVATITGQ